MSLATTRKVIMTTAPSGCARSGKRVPCNGYGEAPHNAGPVEFLIELGAALCVRIRGVSRVTRVMLSATNVKTETD